jgi:hypothetical protein
MKLAIMQPYFFPYIGYFQLINAVDTFVIYDDVQYIARGWINRNYFLRKDGKFLFTIPVAKYKQGAKINEVLINSDKWKEDLKKMLFYTYKRAPFYKKVLNSIENLFLIESDNLSEYCAKSIELVCQYVGVNTQLLFSSNIKYDNFNKIKKINSILKNEKASSFVLPPGSKELYKSNDFIVPTSFLIPNNDLNYLQFSKKRFESNLSIIDIMMFNSKKEIKKMLNEYSLI